MTSVDDLAGHRPGRRRMPSASAAAAGADLTRLDLAGLDLAGLDLARITSALFLT